MRFSPVEAALASERFYKHVDKAHAFKIQAGAAESSSPELVFDTMDAVLQDDRENLGFDNWPQDMKQSHE